MADVKDEQVDLNELGANPKLVEDGLDGPKTDAAIQAQLDKDAAALGVTSSPVVPPIKPIQPTGGPTKGIDIYHGDTINSWSEILNAGFVYVFIKASDGSGTDPQFVNYFQQAKTAGLLVGGYHFYEPSVSVQTQINDIVARLQAAGWQAGVDLPPVLDFETFSSSDPTPTDYANANAFLSGLQSALKVKVIIYASDSVITNAPNWISSDVVWDARYGSQPKYPNWTFFQNSGSASVPGLNGGSAGSDTDVFQGSLDQLKVWIASSVI